MSSVLESLDAGLTGLLGQWNGYSTGLVTVLVAFIGYRILYASDPDVHPILLARQATPSTVRNEGESAVYRSPLAPHGMPLNAGLNVKEAGASKWSRGRDGDLGDIWRKVVLGGDGGIKGKLLTVHGTQNIEEHDLDDLTRQINIIGQHIAEQGGIRVGIYLPNSIELLAALFACSFGKNLTAVLIPFGVPEGDLVSMLRRSAVDTVITATGEFPFDSVASAYTGLRQLIWVVDRGSSHLDWSEVPEGIGGKVSVGTWQDIVHDASAADSSKIQAAADDAKSSTVGDVVTFWQNGKPGEAEMVRFTQANLVSGIAGQLAAIPTKARLSNEDLFLPADALTNISTLIFTLAALYSNASVAINSATVGAVDLTVALQGVAPTVVVANPACLLETQKRAMAKLPSGLGDLAHWLSKRTLVNEGIGATSNFLSAFAASARPVLGNSTPGKLRVIYTAERAGAAGNQPGLSPQVLTDLRIVTGARIVYALSAAKVAGAVTQTAFYDYRVDVTDTKGHFGAPTSSLEVLLKDKGSHKTTDDDIEGEIFARGPCVSGGEAGLGVVGVIRSDGTLAYA